MAEIKWTEQALADVEAIATYIARDSLYYARMHAQRIFESVKCLKIFPESGKIVPEINKSEMREIILGNYRVIYRHRQNVVEIITVYHSAQPPSLG